MLDRFFRTETDDGENLKKKLSLLQPQLDRLVAEKDAERVQEQKALLPQLETLKHQRESEIPNLQAKVEEFSNREKQLLSPLEEVRKLRGAAASAVSARSYWFDHQIGLIQSRIYELASPVIGERQKKWRAWIDETRLKTDTEIRHTQPNIFGIWHKIFVSNLKTIQHRVDVIRRAIETAERLKFEPLLENKIIEKLDGLEQEFPPLTNHRETVTIKAPDVTELRRAAW